MNNLPDEFLSRMERLLGASYPAFLAEYGKRPVRGLRANTLKIEPGALSAILDAELTPAPELDEGFIIESGTVSGADPYHMAGLFYFEEPSAMAAIAALDIRPGMRVLDLCAAPGGKAGGIAARLRGSGLLVANEPIAGRARLLVQNLERLGPVNAAVTNAYPAAVADALPGFFDAVLVDAPCSGEGMFRKDAAAISEWSPGHVRACAARQREILACAARSVRPGGALVYSTCTFSEEENEYNIEHFLKSNEGFSLEYMHRLYPHELPGEGHFVARLIKASGTEPLPMQELSLQRLESREFDSFMTGLFERPPALAPFALPDGRVLLMGSGMPAGLARLHLLAAGVFAGESKKGRFEPAHSLFLAAHGGIYRSTIELHEGSPELLSYLHGETVPVSAALSGFVPVAAGGYVLGFGKAVAGTLKNRLPKGLRHLK